VSIVSGSRRAVFLDRDGVLNAPLLVDGASLPPTGDGDLELMPGALDGCRALRDAGYLLLVVTNQPDVSRGRITRDAVEATNTWLKRMLPVDAIYVCPHDDADGCECRKPLPGLLTRAAQEWNVNLSSSFMIGDRWRDVDAGTRAGCTTVLVGDGRRQDRPVTAHATVADLAEAARWILAANGTSPADLGSRPDVRALRVKIFADGADPRVLGELAHDPLIRGFTTNPTLMRAAGISDYEAFAREMLEAVSGRPVSFEVFDHDFDEMERQALKIASWGENVYVKIPITDTEGASSERLIRRLADGGVQLNVTALLTLEQVETVRSALAGGPSAFVSMFAGRVADTGRDPVPHMARAVELLADQPQIELIWASPREVLNIFQADATGCHIITVTPDLLKKLPIIGRDLNEYSVDTVKMFHRDAEAAGYQL
jgi:transaldolase